MAGALAPGRGKVANCSGKIDRPRGRKAAGGRALAQLLTGLLQSGRKTPRYRQAMGQQGSLGGEPIESEGAVARMGPGGVCCKAGNYQVSW
jgi:hypothetical protein